METDCICEMQLPETHSASDEVSTSSSMCEPIIGLINKKYEKKRKRDIWEDSQWKNISKLENDDVGGVGEEIIHDLCSRAGIICDIDGKKTKQSGGGKGDGTISGKTCEIKTARLGSDGKTFQHDFNTKPWSAEYIVYLDITPNKIYFTMFKNFSQEFWKESGKDSKKKCYNIFPTKSVTWRDNCTGNFKLDTSISIDEACPNTFTITETTTDYSNFKTFVETQLSKPSY